MFNTATFNSLVFDSVVLEKTADGSPHPTVGSQATQPPVAAVETAFNSFDLRQGIGALKARPAAPVADGALQELMSGRTAPPKPFIANPAAQEFATTETRFAGHTFPVAQLGVATARATPSPPRKTHPIIPLS